MKMLSKLAPKKGSTSAPKRLGRGKGSGLGQTSGKGHKGQLARSGGKVRRGFEGGQSPLVRRLPKFGFSNVSFENRFSIVNVGSLNKLSGEVTPQTIIDSGLAHKMPIKILGQGELKVKLSVKAHKFSDSAKKAIETAGGKVEVIE